ncbi:hypothetical protein A3F03_01360 [Candidatus Roizmanbacteria bacterium RIFCSPHIGHO2_12_FULL_41_11]|uniref:Glycosyltransferase RgtA/B/C/D-like domain-containing protein n=1 Tax=Candidatus Roizmanbacteria bacterium RIFCSPHIGHO2_12_FULL_41_11 TaxID=1802052 RepID=A0A1F7I4Q6_9BACT|nr:MAG: hypothetical protein A3F03_01360 [Candidatus Roizmanbacteria bacterium RIFCSPHIGHO2_12_FULL_41_11]
MRLLKNRLFIFIFLGLILRLSLIFLDFSFDVNNHMAWGKDMWLRGLSNFYDLRSSEVYASAYPNYPPLANYLFFACYLLRLVIFKLAWWLNIAFPIFPSKLILFIDSRVFEAACFKLPAILADLGIAGVVYLFAKKLAPKNNWAKKLAVLSVLFHPTFFYNSAYWGQIDAIPLFFVLVASYLLLFSSRYFTSAMFFIAAILVKPTALVFVLPYSVYFLWKFGWIKSVRAFLLAQAVFILSFLPYISNQNVIFYPYIAYLKKIMEAQSLAYITNNAFNFWMIVAPPANIKDLVISPLGISYKAIGYILFGIVGALAIHYMLIAKDKITVFIFANFFVAYGAVIFLTRMHERYWLLCLPFLLLFTLQNRHLWKWWIIISFISFLNLYHGWSVPRIEPLVFVLVNRYFVLLVSIVNTSIFIYLFVQYLMENWRPKVSDRLFFN